MLGALLVLAPAAGARVLAPWATVNVCDTAEHPDTIGIRGAMPGGTSAGQALFMRFQVEYFDKGDARWELVGPDADSGFIAVGTGRRSRGSGQNFTIRPPKRGAYVLRGLVTFEWREDGDVVRRARRRTARGHPGTPGADPAAFSAATCEVS